MVFTLSNYIQKRSLKVVNLATVNAFTKGCGLFRVQRAHRKSLFSLFSLFFFWGGGLDFIKLFCINLYDFFLTKPKKMTAAQRKARLQNVQSRK